MKIKVLLEKVDQEILEKYKLIDKEVPREYKDIIYTDVYIKMIDVESIWIYNDEDDGLLMNIYFLNSDMLFSAIYDQEFIDRFEEIERNETA